MSFSVALLSLAVIASPAGAGSMYRFEDEQGVVHYTNVPSDPRYGFVRKDPEPTEAKPAAAEGGGAFSRGLRAFAHIIRSAAERYGVDTRLVEAIVQAESAGNPTAVSPKGARGLMQLMPERAAELGVRDSFDPHQNVDGGVRHMRDLLQRFGGDVTLALAAYNAGEAAVRAYGGIPPFAETREYVRRVRAMYDGAGAPSGVALATAPQRIYRAVAEDGTLTFTNLPPRAVTSSGRF
ncbi:MAG TPA: lytic transglycosylase domain-containing protein [Methylomirabilota bacterium]|nr:lytic transglycosylase domain-containing protein [Methylomirabilota bacterium]